MLPLPVDATVLRLLPHFELYSPSVPGIAVRSPSHRLAYSNRERFGLRIPVQALGRKLVALEDKEETLFIRWTERVPVPRRQPVDRALSQTST